MPRHDSQYVCSSEPQMFATTGWGWGAGLLFSTHACLETTASASCDLVFTVPPWSTLTQLSVLPRLFSRFTPSSHSIHPPQGLCECSKFGQKGLGLHIGHSCSTNPSSCFTTEIFFSPLASPSFSFFFFLKTHCTTFQNSLAPSHILGDWSSPHFFFGHNSQSQNLSIWDSAWLQSCPFSLDLALLVPGGTSVVIAPFLRRILVTVITIMPTWAGMCLHVAS